MMQQFTPNASIDLWPIVNAINALIVAGSFFTLTIAVALIAVERAINNLRRKR